MKCPSCGSDHIEARINAGEVVCHHCGTEWNHLARLLLLPQALFNEALSSARIGDWENAEELLFTAVSLQPGSAPAWFLLGKVLAHRGEHVRAISAWKRVIELEPESEPAKAAIAWARAVLKDKHKEQVSLPHQAPPNPGPPFDRIAKEGVQQRDDG